MEPLWILSIGFLLIGLGVYADFLSRRRQHSELRSELVLTDEMIRARLSTLEASVDRVEGSLIDLEEMGQGMLSTNPELAAAVTIHREERSPDPDPSASMMRLLDHVETPEDLLSSPTTNPGVLEGMARLMDDLDPTSTLSAWGLGTPHLKRLAHLSHATGREAWTSAALSAAHARRPGDRAVLAALEAEAEASGSLEERLRWLEARLGLDPDDPILLRRHANLASASDAAGAERSVRRLEALGQDTPADVSLLSGLRARAGSRSEALDAIDRALSTDPNRAEDWRTKASLHRDLGEHQASLDAVERALALDRQDGEAWAIKADLLSKDPSVIDDAIKAATHAVALKAGGAATVRLKHDLLVSAGRQDEAVASIDRALEARPDADGIRALVVEQRIRAGRLEDAWAVLEAGPVRSTAELAIVEGRWHLATADRCRDGTGATDAMSLEAAGAAFETALLSDREDPRAWLGRGRVARLRGDLETARDSIDRAERLAGDVDPSVAAEAAMLCIDEGDLERASQHIDAAAILNPSSPTVEYVRGTICARSARFPDALLHLNNVLAIVPNHLRALLNRSAVHHALEQWDAALEDAEHVLDLAPDLLLARSRRAECKMALGEWEDAEADLAIILATNPDHVHALTQSAACKLAMGRPEHAESPLNQALRLDPDHAPAWHQRGLLYLEYGRIDAALADFERAIRSGPNHLDARLHLAATLQESERHEEALAAWRGVLAIQPDHAVARRRAGECEQMLGATTA